MEGREGVKKKAAHSRLVGGKSNKPGSLLTRLSCVKTRCEWISTPTPRILKVYIEALTGLVMYSVHRVSVTPCSLLEQAPLQEQQAEDRGGGEEP